MMRKLIPICLLCPFLVSELTLAQHLNDQSVYNQIDTIRAISSGLSIDGNNSDWNGIPDYPDPVDDASGDPSRDITSVSLAPRDDAWLLRIETAGTPSQQDLAFWLFIDYRNQQVLDLELGLYIGFPDVLWRYPEGGDPVMSNWDETITVIGNVVEARIPLDALALELPTDMADDLSGPDARSWVRIMPFTRNLQGDIVDYGAAVASYRLITTPYPLDPALPVVPGKDPPDAAIPIPMPMSGMQYVDQGAGGIFSHSDKWAYDLNRVNNALHPDSPHMSADNSDYFSFGEVIRAPASGSVFSTDNSNPDQPPRQNPCNPTGVNFMFLDIGSSVGLLFSHTQQGSIPFSQGNAVNAGDNIGLVGHSGSCSWPHLHLEAQTITSGFPSRPIELTDVDVGLNPADTDPWLRRMSLWGIREGFLVRSVTCDGNTVSVSNHIHCDGFED